MKKTFLILLAVTLLAVLPAASALAGEITNITCTAQTNGTALVRWDGDNSSPYTIYWKLAYCNNSHYDTSSANFYFLGNGIPGETYTITVERGGDSGSVVYTVPRGVFKEWNTAGKGYVQLSERNQGKTDLNYFSLSDLRANPTKMFYLWVEHPALKNERTYAMCVALKTPLGYCSQTDFGDGCSFKNGWFYAIPYNMMDDWLKYVELDYGAIPTGRYTFEVFLDGLLYSSTEFTVNN